MLIYTLYRSFKSNFHSFNPICAVLTLYLVS